MTKLEESFNRSGFSRFLNSPAGRIFRLVGGTAFFIVGIVFMDHWLGVASIVWGLLAISAGGLDVCYFSVVLGGPFSGKRIRSLYGHEA